MNVLKIVVLISMFATSSGVIADDECNKIRECFDRVVEIASDLVEQNKRLEKKVKELETSLSSRIDRLAAFAEENRRKLAMGAHNCEWIVVGGGIGGAKETYCPAGKVLTGIEQHYDGGKGHFRHWIQKAHCCAVHN